MSLDNHNDVGQSGGWMQTRSGRAYRYQHPQPESIRINDIAHALGMLCRFGGHTERFYSVAEHSVHVSYCVPVEHALVALMHDATEAYVIDVPRPLKHLLGGVYADLEDKAWQAICRKFNLRPILPACVKDADNAVLLAERRALLCEPPIPWTWADGIKPAPVKIECWDPATARIAFLERYMVLRAGVQGWA